MVLPISCTPTFVNILTYIASESNIIEFKMTGIFPITEVD